MTEVALDPDRLRLLEALRGGKVRRAGSDIPVVDRSGPLPVSFTQRRLFFLDQLVPGSPAYLIFQTARLGSELDVPALRSALGLLIRRHEALRTGFTAADGEPMQVVRPAENVADVLATAPAGDPEEVFRAWVRRPFDLSADAMMRALLMPVDDGWAFGLCVHHIAADAWSVAQLLRELATAYEAFATGREPALQAVTVAYPDIAAWQRSRATAGVDHWLRELSGAPDLLDLPFDRPRPAIQSFAGGRLVAELPADLAARLADVGRAADATQFMTLFAVFAMLLSRYSGRTDILVGVPVAGRSRVEFESVVGFFANTVVLRTDLSGDPSFTVLLRRVRETALRAYAHQELPFEVLVDKLAPRRDMSHNPLFQVKFALQNAPAEPFRLPGVRTEPFEVDNDTAKFDLSLDITDVGGALEVAFEYDSALFDESTVGAAAQHYRALCEAVTLAPGAPVGTLPMLDADERGAVLDAGVGPLVPHDRRTVPELIAARTADTPDAPAVVFGATTLSYRELDERAHRLAHHLRSLGAGQDTCVAVHLHRSTELVVALLGVLRSGAAYLPVDPGYPAERVAYLLSDASAPLVITQPGLAVPDGEWEVLELDAASTFDMPSTPAVPSPDPDSLAYVIYTSGSTGRPKGAMVHHRALTNRLAWMRDRYRVTADDRIAQKTPYSFDVSVWEFFLPLISGATLVVAEPGAHQDPARLAELFGAAGVTIAHFVPPMLAAFLDQPDRPDLPALRLVVCSGQALPKDLAATAMRELGAACENLYGPTEATIDVSAYTPGSSPYEPRCAVAPIGAPIDNVALRVLGPRLDPLPVGVPGELFLGGAGVGRGYRDRPGLTAQRYLPDPFGPPGAVLYRTGDRARLLPDGNVEFLGRLDDQLKIRGFRVEPGEIEAVLRAHPGVRDAVVVPAPDTEAIVGYVVPAATSPGEPGAWSDRVLGHWTDVWNTVYDTRPAAGPDYSGWRSSRTGADYSVDDMAEWVATTVASVLALRPKRVLEIGCGSGLLFRELRGYVDRYVGTDLSQVVVDRLAAATSGDDAVEFRCRPAHAIDVDGEFDVVILNSVIQYFPDAGYLARVLDRAVRACRPDGVVFAGDVRDLALREAAALWALTGKRTEDPARLAGWVAAELSRDNELAVAPAFFLDLAAQHGRVADVRLKTGARPTEMNLFRYDVCLRPAGAGLVDPGRLPRIPWSDGALSELPGTPSVVADIPYPAVVGLLNTLRGAESEVTGRAPAELVAALGPGAHCVPALDNPGHFHAVLTGDPYAAIATESSVLAQAPLTTVPTAREQDRELVSTLREYLRGRLPEYLMPTGLATLAELPLTPNGKVDHRALPVFAPAGPATADVYEAPLPGVETTLATIVENLLGVARVGRRDDFFAIGGESIVALLLVSRARQTGVALSPAGIFQHPTIASMATVAEDLAAPEEHAEEVSAPRDRRPWAPGADVEAAYPLAPMQHEMLSAALERAEPGLHVATVVLRIAGADFDEGAFVAAWQYLMQRHAIFRSSCTWHGLGAPVQTAWNLSAPPVVRVNLRGHDTAEQNRLIRAALLRERQLVADPHTAPQWRITLFATADGYRALLRFTYLFQDGWSFENVQRELFAAYDAIRAGRTSDLPALPAFAEYVDWLTRRDAAGRDADAAYWTAAMRRHRGRTPVLETLGRPTHVGPDEFPYVAQSVTVATDIEAGLRESARQAGITLFSLLQGAWAVLLAAVTEREDVTFGVVCAGRPEQLPRVTEMVGPFNNMLPVPVAVPDGAGRRSWLRELQREQAEMRQHQYTALAQIREWAGLPWREPLYDSYLVFENFPMDEAIGERMAAWEPEDGITQTEHPLRVMVWPAGGLAIEISYYARFFDRATIRRLLDGYLRLVVALAENDDATLADLKKLVADVRGEGR